MSLTGCDKLGTALGCEGDNCPIVYACEGNACEGDPCTKRNAEEPCHDGAGLRFCYDKSDEQDYEQTLEWGGCFVAEPECTPGETQPCPGQPAWGALQFCEVDEYGPSWDRWYCWDTPLVVSFENEPVRYTASSAAFSLTNESCAMTDWPTAHTPWLALDRDRNGSIDGGNELFGNGTQLASGRFAAHGFAALADLDRNGDGRITASDPQFSQLLLWSDHDADKVSHMWELTPLAQHGVTAIELDYNEDPVCDARSNCGIERASITFADRNGRELLGTVIDVHLPCQ